MQKSGTPVWYKTKLNGTWKFYLEKEKIICDMLQSDQVSTENDLKSFRMTYFTQSIFNPIESSAMPMILADRRLSLLSRKEDGSHIARLSIELDKERVVWNAESEPLPPISFEKFLNEGWIFPSWFADALFMDQSELNDKVLKIIKNKKVIDSLYSDYFALIEEVNDFSLTGHLN